MSSVILHVGQCGNQIGESFWDIILKNNNYSPYVHADGKLRSVHVDTEPKAVYSVLSRLKESHIRSGNIVTGRRGRGSNWALGYYGTKVAAEDKVLENSIEAVRKEIERCDSFCGIVVLHSLGGGTGSGLGSRLCECLRDEYGLHYLVSCVVAPYTTGESPLQNYNALLTLATLHRNVDCVIYLSNDEILYRLEKQARNKDGRVSVAMVNKYIGQCLAGVFMPTDTITPPSGLSLGQEPWQLVQSVCPMPDYKFVNLAYTSKNKQSWEGMTGLLLQSLQKWAPDGSSYKSLGNLVVARGDSSSSFTTYIKQIEAKVKTAYNCVKWNPFPVDFWIEKQNKTSNASASITMASNYSNVSTHVQHIVDRARAKYEAGAYLHWYWKHGAQKDDFEEAFETMETVVSNYTEAVT